VPLDSRFAQSSDMKALMKSYQDQLRVLGWEGVGLKPVPHPRTEAQGAFVGSAKCESCHEVSYKIWKKSGHAKAYETLVKADPPRHFDAECVSCHVVGWHPTQYFPYAGGFWSKEKTPHLIDVGCESCHGPGEAHVLAEMKDDEALKEKYRKAVVVTKEESEKHLCVECHDLDNSPDFDFKTYWPLVEHYETE
jgi:formate-dependent nitrite reductase cytochrome c552 subunit